PPALRGRGLGESGQQAFSYSGPAEGGGEEKYGEENASDGGGRPGTTRRERREQARQRSKAAKRH
ncbi:MAG TPA: hypothetical protein VF444_20720, partial [Pseudonocardiaceae bacterium]